MAMTPEERRQDRRRREQQRREQAAKQRKMLLRLAVAAVVLIACGVGIFIFARNAPPPVVENTTQPTESIPDTTQETLGPTTTVHLVAGGDLNITDRVVASGGADRVYTNAFLDIAHLLADADISLLNLEGVLTGAPYGGESASAPQSLANALSAAGVDMIQLANSYAIHQGLSGLGTTISSVKAAGMIPVGAYADAQAAKAGKGYVICNVGGIRIAFVAFTKGMDGTSLPAGSESCVNLLYKDYNSYYQQVDTEGISRVLDAAMAEQPDLVVAMVHWGSEYGDSISATQKKICTLMQDKGVDVILGNHPHYVQQMLFDENKGTFVAYSLGDFFSDAARAGTEYSVLLDLEITRDNTTGETKVTGFSYTPIFTVAQEEEPLRVVRIHEAMAAYEAGYVDKVSKETYDAMAYALKRIEARIAGE